MKIVGILTLWTLFVLSAVFSGVASASNIQGFQTQAWQLCDADIPCEIIKPKNWSDDEEQFLSNTILKFKYGGLSHVLTTIQALGFNTIERSSYWYTRDANPLVNFKPSQHKYTTAIAYDAGPNAIAITDYFFQNPLKTDPQSGASMKELILLHEVSHAYDYQNAFSGSEEFQQLAGFVNSGSFYPKFSKCDPNDIREKDLKLQNEGRYKEAHLANRAFAMKCGMPTPYGMSNPAEAFAELSAYIYFDPNAPKYIDAKLIEYMDRVILKGARQ